MVFKIGNKRNINDFFFKIIIGINNYFKNKIKDGVLCYKNIF